MIHALASQPHYADHLAPVWAALPRELRGTFYDRLPRVLPDGQLWLAASAIDSGRLTGRRVVLVEHGAGQSYQGDSASASSGSYSGGRGHEHVVLFVAPHQTVADRWQATYPATPVAVVGCPKLDRWHREPRTGVPGSLTVAITFHWSCGLIPETQWAMPAYRPHLRHLSEALRGVGASLVGHAHPRARRQLAPLWGRVGVPMVDDLAVLLDQADVLVADNTSALYEFASLDRPVVVLNAPWYRRDVEHGLRFWSAVPGVQVDHGDQLAHVVVEELANPARHSGMRAAAVAAAYAATDGHAAERAVTAILEVL